MRRSHRQVYKHVKRMSWFTVCFVCVIVSVSCKPTTSPQLHHDQFYSGRLEVNKSEPTNQSENSVQKKIKIHETNERLAKKTRYFEQFIVRGDVHSRLIRSARSPYDYRVHAASLKRTTRINRKQKQGVKPARSTRGRRSSQRRRYRRRHGRNRRYRRRRYRLRIAKTTKWPRRGPTTPQSIKGGSFTTQRRPKERRPTSSGQSPPFEKMTPSWPRGRGRNLPIYEWTTILRNTASSSTQRSTGLRGTQKWVPGQTWALRTTLASKFSLPKTSVSTPKCDNNEQYPLPTPKSNGNQWSRNPRRRRKGRRRHFPTPPRNTNPALTPDPPSGVKSALHTPRWYPNPTFRFPSTKLASTSKWSSGTHVKGTVPTTPWMQARYRVQPTPKRRRGRRSIVATTEWSSGDRRTDTSSLKVSPGLPSMAPTPKWSPYKQTQTSGTRRSVVTLKWNPGDHTSFVTQKWFNEDRSTTVIKWPHDDNNEHLSKSATTKWAPTPQRISFTPKWIQTRQGTSVTPTWISIHQSTPNTPKWIQTRKGTSVTPKWIQTRLGTSVTPKWSQIRTTTIVTPKWIETRRGTSFTAKWISTHQSTSVTQKWNPTIKSTSVTPKWIPSHESTPATPKWIPTYQRTSVAPEWNSTRKSTFGTQKWIPARKSTSVTPKWNPTQQSHLVTQKWNPILYSISVTSKWISTHPSTSVTPKWIPAHKSTSGTQKWNTPQQRTSVTSKWKPIGYSTLVTPKWNPTRKSISVTQKWIPTSKSTSVTAKWIPSLQSTSATPKWTPTHQSTSLTPKWVPTGYSTSVTPKWFPTGYSTSVTPKWISRRPSTSVTPKWIPKQSSTSVTAKWKPIRYSTSVTPKWKPIRYSTSVIPKWIPTHKSTLAVHRSNGVTSKASTDDLVKGSTLYNETGTILSPTQNPGYTKEGSSIMKRSLSFSLYPAQPTSVTAQGNSGIGPSTKQGVSFVDLMKPYVTESVNKTSINPMLGPAESSATSFLTGDSNITEHSHNAPSVVTVEKQGNEIPSAQDRKPASKVDGMVTLLPVKVTDQSRFILKDHVTNDPMHVNETFVDELRVVKNTSSQFHNTDKENKAQSDIVIDKTVPNDSNSVVRAFMNTSSSYDDSKTDIYTESSPESVFPPETATSEHEPVENTSRHQDEGAAPGTNDKHEMINRGEHATKNSLVALSTAGVIWCMMAT